MKITNTANQYGLISVGLHWLMALLIFGLFALGLYMTDLGYYDPWYKKGPDLHRSLGLIVALLLLARLAWRRVSPKPLPQPNHQPWEHRLAELTHKGLFALLGLILISGYLISTADGRPVSLFGWTEIPALISDIDGQEDAAGAVHLWLAWTLIALVALHAAGALKHQLIDGDGTLSRIFGRSPTPSTSDTAKTPTTPHPLTLNRSQP